MKNRFLNKKFVAMMLVLGSCVGCEWFKTKFASVSDKVVAIHKAGDIDEKDEDQLGQSVAIAVTNRYPPTDNKLLVQYVNLVGYTLVSTSDKPAHIYHFGVLESPDLEAYSGPGGYIMITTGLIHAMQDEGELAGVLGHELTHVMEQHGLEEAKRAARTAGYISLADEVMPGDSTKYLDLGVNAVVKNGYDKPHENAADRGAVHLMVAAGYDPRSYTHFLARLTAMQQYDQSMATTKQTGTQQVMAKVMDSHPDLAGRYLEVHKEITEAGATGGAVMADRFLAYTKVH